MYIRTYFEKDTEIRQGSTLNYGRNEIARVENEGSLSGITQSRYIFQFPLDNLTYHYENCNLGDLSKVKHEIVLYPNRQYFDNTYLPASLTFCLVALEQPWDAGCSSTQFEEIGCIGFTTVDETANREGAANWFYAQDGVLWDNEGGFVVDNSGNVLNVVTCQTYSCDDQELRFDVTEWVNYMISGTAINYGFGISLFNEYGTPFNGKAGLGFNTIENKSYFKPFLETIVNNPIIDNSDDFHYGTSNLITLDVNIKGSPIRLDENPIVDIVDGENNVIFTNTAICMYQGIYGVEVDIDGESENVCTSIYAIWRNLRAGGRTLKAVEVEIYPKNQEDLYTFGKSNKPQKITHNHWGIHYDEKITRGEIKRIYAQSYMPFSQKVAQYDSMWYRIYLKQGSEHLYLMDWQLMNQTNCQNWFDLFTDWMQAQIYYIEFKTLANGIDYLHENKLRFKILE